MMMRGADICELAVLLLQTCKGRASLSHNHEEEATPEPFLLFCSWHLVPIWTPYPLSHTWSQPHSGKILLPTNYKSEIKSWCYYAHCLLCWKVFIKKSHLKVEKDQNMWASCWSFDELYFTLSGTCTIFKKTCECPCGFCVRSASEALVHTISCDIPVLISS